MQKHGMFFNAPPRLVGKMTKAKKQNLLKDLGRQHHSMLSDQRQHNIWQETTRLTLQAAHTGLRRFTSPRFGGLHIKWIWGATHNYPKMYAKTCFCQAKPHICDG